MKKSELAFSALLVPLDYAVLIAAGLVAYHIRFGGFVSGLRPVQEVLTLATFVKILAVVAAVWIGIFALTGLYTFRSTRRTADEIAKIFLGCSTGILLVIVAIFFQREFFSSRFVVLASWILAFVFLVIEHAIVRGIQHALFTRGIGVHNLIIIGTDESADEILKYINRSPSLGFRLVERYESVTPDLFDRMMERMRTMRIDEVLLTDPKLSREDAVKVIDFCNDHHLIFKFSADLFDTRASRMDIQTLAGIPIIEIKRTPLDGWGKIIKRSVDAVASSILLVVLSPIMFIIGILVKIDSEGPVILKLERVGENGKLFSVLKFRSMVKNAHALKEQLMDRNERDGPLFKMRYDPRITRFGRCIRRSSLDELPQLWNVLKGEMSLVGPRPHEPEEVAQYEKPYRKLLSIKPGITGMAQTSGRSDLTFSEEAKLDTYYIENWSLKLDLQIFMKTPWVVMSTRSAL